MSSKERISTRADSRERRKLTLKTETKVKHFQIFYHHEKLLTIEIQANKTVKDLEKLIKHKIKDRFYNFMGLQSTCGLEVLDYSLQNKEFPLEQIHQGQKFRILLEGQVHDLSTPSINDFFFIKCLGKGGSSNVYLVRHKQNCRLYALKQVQKTYITDFKKMEFLLSQPENILIDLKGNAVLSDFGLCKVNVRKEDLTISYCGSDIYMPPQVKDQVGYNYHADFYTLGAFLYEMITGLPPYYNSQSLEFPQKASIQVIQLCLKLLESDLKKRLCDFRVLKESKWLKNIDLNKLKNKEYQMPIRLNLYKTYIHEDFREPLTFDEINETIFDRLFDFFFYMQDNQKGISSCYVTKSLLMKKPGSKIIHRDTKKGEHEKEKSKGKQKSHKNSTQKFNKLIGKQPELGKMKQKSKKKSQKSSSNYHGSKEGKSKSYKKRSTQNSPCLHNLQKQKQKKKQKQISKGQKQYKQDEKVSANIYQKSITSPVKLEMKNVKGSIASRSSYRSPQLTTVMQSPLVKRKNV